MNAGLKNNLTTPLIGAVFALDDYIILQRQYPPKWIRHTIIDPVLIHQCGVLYAQAIRELRGLDYLKRATETLQEIQATSFRIYHMGGWSLKTASHIDTLCDRVFEELSKRRRYNASPMKSKDEHGSA